MLADVDDGAVLLLTLMLRFLLTMLMTPMKVCPKRHTTSTPSTPLPPLPMIPMMTLMLMLLV